ncbi:hypothetical protein CYLTODRAFT_357472, partial [Cylindrobasidium torrendii FP15055 ss-10]
MSWANGCWIGQQPPELQGLTYAEELVIARAHTTKCWVKLKSRQDGRVWQKGASGNVCIHPHEVTNIATVLPRPIDKLYDEIAVIIVTDDKAVTPETIESLKSSPVLVRRKRILDALVWLKSNNVLYKDITIDGDALATYPDDYGHPAGSRPMYPIHLQPANATRASEGANYATNGYGMEEAEGDADGAEDAYAQAEGEAPATAQATFDVDNNQKNLKIRKLQALIHIKENGDFLKTSKSSVPINTRSQPKLFGYLFPTLFPYGVGLFE